MRGDPAAGYFEGISGDYATRYGAGGGLWHRAFFEGRRAIALKWLRELRGGTVADVGAGPGPLTGALRAQGCHVLAFDRSEGMLHEAQRQGARAAVADALALPLADGVCDAATALGLASYVPDLTALLTELRRVVRPGGLVVVSVASAMAPDWIARRALRAPARALKFRGVLTSGLELAVHRPAAWRAAAAGAGLSIEEVRGHDFTLFPLSRLLPGPSIALSRACEAALGGRLAPLASEVVLRLRVPGKREAAPRPPAPDRVVRVIARLNVGGPAVHATLLSNALRPRYATTLATGAVADDEIEATDLLARFRVAPVRIRGLGRTIAPFDDARALFALMRLFRRERPGIVHTHTAKAGALGRVAARLCGVPHVVHTFHGHVLSGYFGPVGSRLAVFAERALARMSDRVVAVSPEVGRDLTERFGVVPAERLRVVPLGLPLATLLEAAPRSGTLRAELALDADTPLVGMIGRLVPVKEPHVALEAFALVRAELPAAWLVVVGAGELHAELVAREEPGVRFVGWRRDLESILPDLDVALLTSRNEGTPVALIEAAAAQVPAVATDVGGVPAVVEDGVTGLLAPRGDARALADALLRLLRDADLRRDMGALARERVRTRFGAERLAADVTALYDELLGG